MPPKKTEDDLLAELDSLGIEQQAATTTTSGSRKAGAAAAASTQDSLDEDAFAEIEKQLAAKKTSSRPSTPRLSSSTTTTTTSGGTAKATPASTSVGSSQRNSSEGRAARTQAPARSSAEGGRSFHQSQTAEAEDETPAKAANSSGGWWGSMYSAASAAVKQAETLAKEIRGNEEAQKWAEQVRGNLSNLQSIGTDLRTRAMPTFTSLISHIAPPISAHERLQIHTTHDIQNYPSLDPLIYATFSRVMSQVEGGDLLVIQRGSESRNRSASQSGYRGAGVLGGNGASWTDGPWYRESAAPRSLGSVAGLKEGTRLVRVSAEAYAKEFFESRGGVEAAAQRATEELSESNPVRSSDIFLAIQAISYKDEKDFFAGDSQAEKSEEVEEEEESVVFAIYLHDPIHSLSFKALSQPFPLKWATWLDASAASEKSAEGTMNTAALPESIQELIAAGGVDPREWVVEWIEEVLQLGVGVVAQQYVAKRMGVGEGGIGRGKRRVEEDGGGEAARAI